MSRPADHERVIAQLITGSIRGKRWRDLTPLEIAKHLVDNGVRYVLDPAAHDTGGAARRG